MVTMLNLHLQLISDATFGRGDGVAGLVDEEITNDPATGLPFVRGRVLKGLLVEECANILYALQGQAVQTQMRTAADYLFGRPGSQLGDDANMRVGAAHLPLELRQAVKYALNTTVDREKWTAADVLESLTAVRRQTAVDEKRGAPEHGSLRAMRVLLRQTELTAQLTFTDDVSATSDASEHTHTLPLLAACVAGLRRGGSGRNRGRGRLEAWLEDKAMMQGYLAQFEALIKGGTS